MSTPGTPPRRVRVTSPRTTARRTRRSSASSEIDARTRLGEIYVATLLRAQLRLALGVLAMLVGPLAGLPLLFRAVPETRERLVVGMPLPWVLLAFAVYPFLFLCGWFYVRRAERNERDFARVLGEQLPAEDDER